MLQLPVLLEALCSRLDDPSDDVRCAVMSLLQRALDSQHNHYPKQPLQSTQIGENTNLTASAAAGVARVFEAKGFADHVSVGRKTSNGGEASHRSDEMACGMESDVIVQAVVGRMLRLSDVVDGTRLSRLVHVTSSWCSLNMPQ